MTTEPFRLVAGEPNPLTPAEMLAAGIPAGSVATAGLVNAALDRMRANSPDGQLPAHVQARLDQIAAARIAAETSTWPRVEWFGGSST